MLEQVEIVLVHTTHPGNIGATARAMKNMGLSRLVLVSPKCFPDSDADARASGATDILENARVVETLSEAISSSSLVVGTSARQRHIPWPLVNPRELASIANAAVSSDSDNARVSILFGREATGLTNEELHTCHHHVHIPTNPDFSSLNIAAAVQVICYELRMAIELSSTEANRPNWGVDWDIELARADELEQLFDHLESTLVQIEFLDPDNPRQLMPRLKRLLLRAIPDKVEVNILRGILKKINRLNQSAG